MHSLRAGLSALTLFLIASSADAIQTAWYTFGVTGIEGQVLDLTCDTSGPSGVCSYDITMRVNGDDAVGLIAWASDLHSSSDSDCATAFGSGPPGPIPPPGGSGGCGSNLLTGSQWQSFGAPLTGTASVLFITLDHSYVSGELGTSFISETAGNGSTGIVWAGGDGDYGTVSFAGGTPVYHVENNPGGLVIRITNVPEPAALGALGLGALAVLPHRRRTARSLARR